MLSEGEVQGSSGMCNFVGGVKRVPKKTVSPEGRVSSRQEVGRDGWAACPRPGNSTPKAKEEGGTCQQEKMSRAKENDGRLTVTGAELWRPL